MVSSFIASLKIQFAFVLLFCDCLQTKHEQTLNILKGENVVQGLFIELAPSERTMNKIK